MQKILIIDDEKDICFLISEILKDEKYLTDNAVNSNEAIEKFNSTNPDLVILDVWLSNSKLDGIELLKEFKKLKPNIPVIIISGHGTVDLAVKAIKNGAYDFIEKPFNSDKLIILTKRAIESSQLLNENVSLKTILTPTIPLIGRSSFIKNISKKIPNIANQNSRILITGEIGTGKKLISKKIHSNSKFKEKLPIIINFKQLSNQNIENFLTENLSNLNDNLFIRSNNNTLVLENIDHLPLNFQKIFLHFLENKSFFDKANINLDQKIISISERNLSNEVESGNFTKRLYERISLDNIECPSIRSRREDIIPIVEHYLKFYNKNNKINISFSNSAISKLELYDWPGNILQIINYIEKTIILNQSSNDHIVLDIDDLALEMGDYINEFSQKNNFDLSIKEARNEFEKEYLLSQIKRFNGNMTKVSEFTGMERTALYRKIKSLKIT
tara:strand:- start:2968 stop:4299 length:1332 start_codon:yes stop_codon:yes gene_type:complete